MKTYFPTLKKWMHEETPFAIARVIKTWGSSPRPVASVMLISKAEEMVGSVSGGCVEGAILKASESVIQTGKSQLLHFGIADEDAWEVGLSCGGKVSVFLERCPRFSDQLEEQSAWENLYECLEKNVGCILITKLEAGIGQHTLVKSNGESFGKALSPELLEKALSTYSERRHQVIEIGQESYFIQIFPPKSQMLIIGAAHISAELVRLAKLFDFETIVIDPRTTFAEKTTFPVAPDQIHDCYPNEILNDFALDAYSYAVVLSHDPKIDDPALQILLKSDIAYIGALGSRKTQAKRADRLMALGFSSQEIERIHGPIGIDINAKRPKEIALSIMAEIVKTQNQFK